MKRIILNTCLIFLLSAVVAQNVDRQYVLLEKFTGVACPPCAQMAGDLEKAVEDGCDFALIEYHQYKTDQYSTAFGASRNTYYDEITGYPALFFDGEFTGSMVGRDYYETIVEYYNRLKQVKSPLFIEVNKIQGETVRNWSFNVKINKVNPEFNDDDQLKMFAVITESDIRQIWGSGNAIHDRLNNVCRTAYNTSGNYVTFSNNIYQTAFDISLGGNVQIGNCEAVFFVQNMTTKEVIQAYKVKLIDEEISVSAPTLKSVSQLPGSQSAMIEWDAPTTKIDNKLLGYNIYDKAHNKVNRNAIITSTSFATNKTSVAGQQCFYVTAVYELIESGDSNSDCVNISLLTMPTAFDTIGRGNDANIVKLKWDAPEGYQQGSGLEQYIAGYNIYRNAKIVNEKPLMITEFTDEIKQPGKYAYQITAVYSNPLTGEIESPQTNPLVVEVKTIDEKGVKDLADLGISIFPNPVTQGIININGEYDSFTIIDSTGKVVMTGKDSNQILNISSLRSGLYMICIEKDGFRADAKILKK